MEREKQGKFKGIPQTMDKKHLTELEGKSEYIIREIKSRFKNPCILFSGGKDSTVLVYLVKQACMGEVPFPVVHIDTEKKFKEVYEFRDKLVKDWNLNLRVAKNMVALTHGINFDYGREKCCHLLKTVPLMEAIQSWGYDAVLVGIRRDEHSIRNKEHYFSPRDKEFKWNYAKEKKGGDSGLESLQDPEFFGWDIFSTDFKDANHVRVHPMLHWTEQDVWEYIKMKGIEVNPLYFAKNGKRYRSIGCECCTSPIESDADTIDKIVKELEETHTQERAGRAKDKEQVMEKLRSLGYM